MAHRFFVPGARISGETVHFSEDQRRQIKSVLRLKPGNIVAVFDNSGKEYETEIRTLDKSEALGGIISARTPDVQPKARITLVQSLPKGEKIEWILQKCTELGVAEFLITETERSVPKTSPEKIGRKLERWGAIVREATEQSGGTIVPSVRGPMSFHDAVAGVRDCDISVMAWEGERAVSLAEKIRGLSDGARIALFIGPEGGFTDEEVSKAKSQGVVPVSLGSRVLRVETAAIVGSALIICGLES